MASRRQKKEITKRKQLQRKIDYLRKMGKKSGSNIINVKKYTERELKRLENLNRIRPIKIQEVEGAIERARSDEDIKDKTRASNIGSYYKHDLMERYYDLVNAGYIEPKLTEQEVYDMGPQIIQELTDEEELQRMVDQGERKMEEARQRNLEARAKNVVVFDY